MAGVRLRCGPDVSRDRDNERMAPWNDIDE